MATTQVGVSRVLFQTPDGTIYYGLVERSELRVSHFHTMEKEIEIGSMGGIIPAMPADDVTYMLDVHCRKMYNTRDFGVALDFLAGGRTGWPTKDEEDKPKPAEPKIQETPPDEWEQVEI